MNGQVLAAIVTTSGVILTAVLALLGNVWRLKHTMTDQHDQNREATVENAAVLGAKIDLLHDDVRDIAGRLDNHLANHVPTMQPKVVMNVRHNTDGNAA